MTGRVIRLQPRDTLLLEFGSQQYGMSLTQLASAVDVQLKRAYEIAKRWHTGGYVHVSRINLGGRGPGRPSVFDAPGVAPSGPLWVYPTRETAWGYLDFDPGEWFPKASTAAHLQSVTELRLALKGLETDPDEWTSERILRRRVGKREAGQQVPHIHDAWYRDRQGEMWAIEVELTRKFGAGRLLASVDAALTEAENQKLSGVLYFTRGQDVHAAVRKAAAELAQQRGVEALPNLEAHDLDEILQQKKAG